MLKEAKQLHDLGFAIIWIKPRSKAPVRSGWTTGPRTPWAELEKTYVAGYNVGVRTGTPSRMYQAGSGYLACIDVDVKDPAYKDVALERLRKLTGSREYPTVASGSGQGSRHLYCVTDAPFKMVTVAKVPGKWEICIYSDGRQMILPPSIHPNGKAYTWAWALPIDRALPRINMKGVVPDAPLTVDKQSSSQFVETRVDLLNKGVPQAVVALIVEGRGCEDRSAALYGVTVALVRAGLSDNEILTALTTKEFYLGQTAYDHAKTKDRARAAQWVRHFTLDKVRAETGATSDFAATYVAAPALSDAGAQAQWDEIIDQDWRVGIERTSDKEARVKQTFQNVYRILQGAVARDVFRKDEFANTEVYGCDTPWGGVKGAELKDVDTVRIKAWLARAWRIEPPNDKIIEAVTKIADDNRFHPVRDYLDGLEWDGVPRLDTWLKDYHKAVGPEPYLSTVSRKVLCAMVARIYRPGIKFDYVLILEGLQGSRKSTALRTLAGDAWFTDAALDLKNKDAALGLRSKWVFELGELGVVAHSDVRALKAFITQQVDYVRAPYGRRHESHARQCVFIGSTNDEEYLKDVTGNRRFWPVNVGNCDVEALANNRDQLFAEAVVQYGLGENLWIEDAQVEAQASEEQGARVFQDAWVERISQFLNSPDPNFPLSNFSTWDLFDTFGPLNNCSHLRSEQMRVGDILRGLGYKKKRMRSTKGGLKNAWVKNVHT